jgi:hypothetical protein
VQAAARKAYVVLDGTLISIDRVGMRAKADRPHYSGKHKRHGLNVQVLTDPAGRPIRASPALPGSVHNLKAAARRHGLVHTLTSYDIGVLADRGYQCACGTIRVPFHGRDLPTGPAAINTSHARSGLPANEDQPPPTPGRPLHRLRRCPQRGTNLIAAVLALETATRNLRLERLISGTHIRVGCIVVHSERSDLFVFLNYA